jgi:hypothetical protein
MALPPEALTSRTTLSSALLVTVTFMMSGIDWCAPRDARYASRAWRSRDGPRALRLPPVSPGAPVCAPDALSPASDRPIDAAEDEDRLRA